MKKVKKYLQPVDLGYLAAMEHAQRLLGLKDEDDEEEDD